MQRTLLHIHIFVTFDVLTPVCRFWNCTTVQHADTFVMFALQHALQQTWQTGLGMPSTDEDRWKFIWNQTKRIPVLLLFVWEEKLIKINIIKVKDIWHKNL